MNLIDDLTFFAYKNNLMGIEYNKLLKMYEVYNEGLERIFKF